MKYKWYYCGAIQGVCDTYEEALSELNFHLDFDIETIGEYKSESSWGLNETIYFYHPETPDDEIQNDDGAYAPQIQEIE